MKHRRATVADAAFLAEWNHQLIRDERHRNTMTVPELTDRMSGWLAAEYTGVIFEDAARPVAYALYREQPSEIYLRQFFVAPEQRRSGLGRNAMQCLLAEIWPKTKRLTVEVLAENEAGLLFYQSLGYQKYSVALEIIPTR